MSLPIDISPADLEIVWQVLNQHLKPSVIKWVFGSRAKWTAKTYSDLDLALQHPAGKEIPLDTMLDLKASFEDSNLAWTVDVVDLNAIQESFRKIVEQDKVPLPCIMGSEWTTIGAIAQVYDGPHATPQKIEEGPYFLSISSLENGKLDLSKSARISEEQFSKWTKRVTPQAGDVLFSYETRLGEAALMPHNIKACLGRRMGLLRPDTKKVDPRFLLFAYLGPDFQNEIRMRTNYGATVERIALKELPNFPIRLPPLPEQKRIAHILGTLDDKIELNRQTNQTLESMAQAMFKSWFVDFDPVIDNALAAGNPIPEPLQKRAEIRQKLRNSGQAKPLPGHIQKLFPDSFRLTDEMGWVPAGWEKKSIYEYLDIIYGAPFKSSGFNEEKLGMPVIRIRDLKTGKPQYHTEEDHKKKSTIETGYLICGMDAEFRATIWHGETAYLNQRLFWARPKVPYMNPVLAKLLLQPSLDFQENTQVGTTVAHLGKKEIDKFTILIPENPKVLEQISLTMEGIRQRLISNYNQIRSLSKIRDTLLPKLISGELRIPEAEDQVQEAIAS